MKILVEAILEKADLDGAQILKKPIRGLPGITTYSLLISLLNTETIEDAAKYLGYSINPVKQSVRECLLPIFPDRSQEFGCGGRVPGWRFTLLAYIEHKKCYICKRILPFSLFNSHTGNDITNLTSACKVCHNLLSKEHKEYIKIRTPVWSDLEEIAEIYYKCPITHEVDHIIPLRGKNVSGLHVPANLQYLPIEANRIKSNKY